MSSAREVIAGVFQEFRDEGQPINDVVLSVADDAISALTSAGYRIIGPDDLDEAISQISKWADEPDISLTLQGSPEVCERLQGDIRAAIRSLKGGRS